MEITKMIDKIYEVMADEKLYSLLIDIT